MDIIQAAQIFPKENLHEAKEYGVVVYKDQNDKLFHAKLPLPLPKQVDLDPEDFHKDLHGVPLPLHLVYPSYIPEEFTVAPEPLPAKSYVKEPMMLMYKTSPEYEGNLVAEMLRHEAIACELFKRVPHPNLAKYLGCQLHKGRIAGLCFQRYDVDLQELVTSSPEKVNKKTCLEGIRRGIEHMHVHGYVHNDISPHNIMFDDAGNPIIIDFDSCRPLGSEKGNKFGTAGFYREDAEASEPQNDYYALEMLKKYLDEKIPSSS